MRNVISSELYKILKSKIFYVICIILLSMNAIGTVSTIAVKKLDSFSQQQNVQISNTGMMGYQGSFSGDIIFYIILIFVACLITAEYANGSIRQMACHGIARWKLVFGQYIAMSSVITMILLVFGILNLLSNTILFELGDVGGVVFVRMNMGSLCIFWCMTGIGFFFSYLFKNGSIAIAISMLFILSNKFIAQLLTLVTKNDIFIRNTLSNMRNIIIDFTSTPEAAAKCSIVFLVIGSIAILGASLLFSKRDIA